MHAWEGARASCARSQAAQQTHLGRSSSRRCDLHRPQAAMHFHLHWHRHWRPLQTRAPTLSNVASACPGSTALGDPTGPAQVLGSTLSSRPPRLLWLHTCSSHSFSAPQCNFVAWGTHSSCSCWWSGSRVDPGKRPCLPTSRPPSIPWPAAAPLQALERTRCATAL
jgi:hypothetical protein